MSSDNLNGSFEVLSPWAEADPVPIKGLTAARVTDLAGKKVGLFLNDKRAAPPTMTVVERKLKERFPTSEIRWYYAQGGAGQGRTVAGFEEWIKSVDAVVLAVGD